MMLLSITAVALSCALLLVTASLFTGFISALETSTTRHLGDIVLESPPGLLISEFPVLLDALEQTWAVQAATAVLKNQGLLLIGPGKVRPVRIWGIQLPRRCTVTPLQDSLIVQKGQAGPAFDPDRTGEIGGFVGIGVLTQPDEKTDEYDMDLVRSFLGQKMALTTGSLTVGAEDAPPEDGRPPVPIFKRKVLRFTCTDVMYSGVWDLDEQNVFVPIEALSSLLHPDQSGPVADIIQIRLAPNVSEDVGLAIVRGVWQNFAQDRFSWAPYVSIETSRRLQARMIAEYRKQMGVLLLVFGLVSLSVVLLVFCIFSLLVITKQKDIAILKSCGTGSSQVAGLFLLFGFLNGLTGALLGIAVGCLITWKINPIEHGISRLFGLKLWKAGVYMFTQIPSQVDWPAVGWILLAAVAASVLGAMVPAIRAACVRPVTLLRYE
jgi:ABC-type lipoprotein release transport system permease subunit